MGRVLPLGDGQSGRSPELVDHRQLRNPYQPLTLSSFSTHEGCPAVAASWLFDLHDRTKQGLSAHISPVWVPGSFDPTIAWREHVKPSVVA
jgi:hypothetical protein